MGYPDNVETALAVEDQIRKTGAEPATIALVNGQVRIGLSKDELNSLAKTKDAVKASRRDLGLVLAQRKTGTTTVAATSLIAHAAGINVFVTGGIGGVHRGGESSLDISADLTELSRTPIAVVCAGVKSILDIGRTLEFLETQGVPVVTYKSDSFPSFYTPTSPFTGIARMNSPQECAAMIKAQLDLGLENGSVIAVPIPQEAVEIDGDLLDAAIQGALKEAEALGVKGKDVTPFLLQRVKEVTEGKSLRANIALIKNNALVGGQIAVALAKLNKDAPSHPYHPVAPPHEPVSASSKSKENLKANKIVIFGATNLDIISKFSAAESSGKSAAGSVRFSLGGVGRNMAEACHRTGGNVHFASAIADDNAGRLLLSQMREKDILLPGLSILPPTQQSTAKTPPPSTAFYNAILSSAGDPLSGVSDMSIHSQIPFPSSALASLSPTLLATDANIPTYLLSECIKYARDTRIPVVYEPTSVPKSTLLFKVLDATTGLTIKDISNTVHYITPNTLELTELYRDALKRGFVLHKAGKTAIGPVDAKTVSKAVALAYLFRVVVVKLGRDGVLLVMDLKDEDTLSHSGGSIIEGVGEYVVVEGKVVAHLKSLVDSDREVVNVTGAGDSLVGTILTGVAETNGVVGVKRMVEILQKGLWAAKLSVSDEEAVSAKLSPNLFE
ncbi:hypothetical protein BCR33DRAFT_330149 [Rhizoclosmatium globosum]|uniref:Carbohydrate kinase PfkB domain-containing protein n=1 Tax=Rhizoclosmatium globosum TaxID=329046 RepID=A0A1Y2C577_9FUNG|nr:hypothetical protein BCR33DRAFT_330149 [Rhizoclosmatium globosum]|eukprot:ORY42037.1 hypothetical protein BCR33DRAFT_330149 [Rhizoclosmatium globosum]